MQLLNLITSPRDTTHLYLLEKQIYQKCVYFYNICKHFGVIHVFVNNVKLTTRSSSNTCTQKENIYHQIVGASKKMIQGKQICCPCFRVVFWMSSFWHQYSQNYDDVSDS